MQEPPFNRLLPRPLRGVITAMVTPLNHDLNHDLSLDQAALERLVEHLLAGGVHGLFILGTTGEAPNLPYDLRFALIEQTCRLAANRVPVIVGITDTSYKDSIRTANKAYECGAQAVVAAPPYYFQVSQPELAQYFSRLAKESPLPLFLYHAPLNTQHSLEVDTVARLAQDPNIIGLKDSGLKMGYFHAMQQRVQNRSDFTLLVGPDDLLAEAVLLGAHGGMAGGSNVWPKLFVRLYQAAASGEVKRALVLHQLAVAFGAAVYRSPNPVRGLKCALSLLKISTAHLTLPLASYSAEELHQVETFLQTFNVFDDPAESFPSPTASPVKRTASKH